MYSFPYFKEEDEQVILDFITQHPFAFLTGCDREGKPAATQLPLFLEGSGDKKILRGHLMKGTDHHKAFLHNPNVLAVFTGPHSYVSASWYKNPYQGSTWNYMSVHVHGEIRFLDDASLIEVLRKLTLYFEKNNASSPTVFDNLPDEYTSRLIKAIVAFEIEVNHMEHVFKLSQNRDPESYVHIMEKLKAQGGDGAMIAAEMEKRREKLFPEGQEWNADKFFA